MENICWRCGKATGYEAGDKVRFRDECQFCGAAQHCCRNCRFYKPGAPNDCAVPGTDFIADREGVNFCEEYARRQEVGPHKQGPTKEDVARKLFKDEE